MIDTVLLDLDGPLLDGRMRHYRCYADILAGHGYEPMPMETYWEMKRLRRSRREQLAVSGAEAIYDCFLDEWLQRIERPEYLALDRVQDGAMDQLQAWDAGGIRMVLVTMRNSRVELMRQLQDTRLLPYLASVIDCRHADGGIGKARAVLQQLPDLDRASSLWIGDTEADREAARELACPVCLLTCGLRTEDFLQSLGPDFLRSRLRDVNLNGMVNHVP